MFLILEVVGPLAAALGSAARQVFNTEGGTIGRLRICTWVLPDPYVSAQHAVITFRDGTFLIEDTSVNGVFINTPDNRLPSRRPTPIKSGDWILLDPYEIRAEIVSELSKEDARSSRMSEEDRAKVVEQALERARDALREGHLESASAPLRHLDPLGTLGAAKSEFRASPSAEIPAGEPSKSPSQGNVAEHAPLAAARFAVYAPPRMQRAQQCVLEVWAYRPELHEIVAKEAMRNGRAELLGSKGPLSIQVGGMLAVTILLPGFLVHPAADSVLWDGAKANTSFLLTAEAKTSAGLHIGTATILSGTVPITLVHFGLWLDDQPLNEPAAEIHSTSGPPRWRSLRSPPIVFIQPKPCSTSFRFC